MCQVLGIERNINMATFETYTIPLTHVKCLAQKEPNRGQPERLAFIPFPESVVGDYSHVAKSLEGAES